MAELILQSATVAIGSVTLVQDASLSLNPGELIVIVGENGAGKSSLMRAMAGYLPLQSGECLVVGQSLTSMSATARARRIAWLPQSVPLAWPIRVRDAVALGRFPHGAAPSRLSNADAATVERALNDCDLLALADRSTATLSGGELARVHIARAFASEASILLADEPVAALDPRHQLATMRLFRTMVDNGGSAVIVLHDLALAARFADRIIGMKNAHILVDAAPATVVSPLWMSELFGVEAVIDDTHGWPQPTILSGQNPAPQR